MKPIASKTYDLPPAMIDLAKRRTEFLFRLMTYGDQPMRTILASAYMQGMNDMFEVIEKGDHPITTPRQIRT